MLRDEEDEMFFTTPNNDQNLAHLSLSDQKYKNSFF